MRDRKLGPNLGESCVFVKLIGTVIAVGACACGLLSLRQQRFQAASELAQAQMRINAADDRLLMLRAKISNHTTPGNVREMAAGVSGELKPLIGDPLPTALPEQPVIASGSSSQPKPNVVSGSGSTGKAAGVKPASPKTASTKTAAASTAKKKPATTAKPESPSTAKPKGKRSQPGGTTRVAAATPTRSGGTTR